MWFTLRIVSVASFFVTGCLFDPVSHFLEELLEVPAIHVLPPWAAPAGMLVLLLIAACVAPFLILGVVGVQVVNPLRSKPFRKPTWHTNFLDVRDPNHFLHLFGYCLIAAAAGRGIVDLFYKGAPGISAVAWLAGGFAFLAGVRMATHVYRAHYQGRGSGGGDAQ